MPSHGDDTDPTQNKIYEPDAMTADADSSAIGRAAQRHKQKAEHEQKIIEDTKQWKAAVNRIVSSEDGELMIKHMLRHNKLFKVDKSGNAVKLVEGNACASVYLELFRPFIDPSLLGKLETQDYTKE